MKDIHRIIPEYIGAEKVQPTHGKTPGMAVFVGSLCGRVKLPLCCFVGKRGKK